MKTKTISSSACGVSKWLTVVATALLAVVAQPVAAGSSLVAVPPYLRFTQFDNKTTNTKGVVTDPGSVSVNLTAVPRIGSGTTGDGTIKAAIGGYDTQVSSASGSFSNSPTFESYCIDVWQTLSFGTKYSLGSVPTGSSPYQSGKDYTYQQSLVGYTPKSGVEVITPLVVQNLSRLYNEVKSGGYFVTHTSTTSQATIRSAALQLAIWEIVYDTNAPMFYDNNPGNDLYNLLSGDFFSINPSTDKAATETVAQAQSWLNHLSGYSSNKYYVNGYISGQRQDVIIFTAVPEPETYVLLLAGLGLMGGVARRRKRANAAN